MLRIRLRRMGNRHRAFFRIVVSDSRKVPTSSALEEIGYYDPKKQPATVKVDFDRYEAWVERGAQASATVRKLVASARNTNDETPVAAAAPVSGATENAPAEAGEAAPA